MVAFPLMVVPAGFTSDGLPIGLELMGRPFAEPTLIAHRGRLRSPHNHRSLPPTTRHSKRSECSWSIQFHGQIAARPLDDGSGFVRARGRRSPC